MHSRRWWQTVPQARTGDTTCTVAYGSPSRPRDVQSGRGRESQPFAWLQGCHRLQLGSKLWRSSTMENGIRGCWNEGWRFLFDPHIRIMLHVVHVDSISSKSLRPHSQSHAGLDNYRRPVLQHPITARSTSVRQSHCGRQPSWLTVPCRNLWCIMIVKFWTRYRNKNFNKWCPSPHCRVLPPSEFNEIIPVAWPMYSESVINIAVIVLPYYCLVTKLQTQSTKNNTLLCIRKFTTENLIPRLRTRY